MLILAGSQEILTRYINKSRYIRNLSGIRYIDSIIMPNMMNDIQ